MSTAEDKVKRNLKESFQNFKRGITNLFFIACFLIFILLAYVWVSLLHEQG